MKIEQKALQIKPYPLKKYRQIEKFWCLHFST